jgi:hypothetical protein
MDEQNNLTNEWVIGTFPGEPEAFLPRELALAAGLRPTEEKRTVHAHPSDDGQWIEMPSGSPLTYDSFR